MSRCESKMIVLVLWLAQEVTVRLHCQLLKKTINRAMVMLMSRSVCKPTVAAKFQTEHRFKSGLICSVQIQTWFSYREILKIYNWTYTQTLETAYSGQWTAFVLNL